MERVEHKIESQGALHPERLGRITGSVAAAAMMKPTTKGFGDLVKRIAFERFTGKQPEGQFDGNFWTDRGHELEAPAVEHYEISTFSKVEPGNFWSCGDWFGASPDGLIGVNGIFEGKAPKWSTQIDYLKSGSLPSQYKWQVVMQLLVTGRGWCDFQSYHPDLPTLLIRVYRDPATEMQLIKALNLVVTAATQQIKELEQWTN